MRPVISAAIRLVRRAEKRVIDQLAGPAVVDDRTAHALDRLLRAVAPALLALSIAERIVICDLPNRGLRAVALPMAGLALAHRVPAGLMLPMIIAAAQGEVLLGPDDLRPRLEAASSETSGGDLAVQSPEPDIDNIPGEQSMGFPPAGAMIIEYLAPRELARLRLRRPRQPGSYPTP